jgi:hypothetical protein
MNWDWNITALFVGLLVFLTPTEVLANKPRAFGWILRTCGLTSALKAFAVMIK